VLSSIATLAIKHRHAGSVHPDLLGQDT
jgi:hypothetical protein